MSKDLTPVQEAKKIKDMEFRQREIEDSKALTAQAEQRCAEIMADFIEATVEERHAYEQGKMEGQIASYTSNFLGSK
ncbi:hypothetical protein EYC80_001002 [Monilinia laxa]|nr:hypothetical protein EYC80_001002 [Monilinia laxa]